MKKITKIEPYNNATNRKTKVASYARVSTSNDDQLMSIENQRTHYEKLIKTNPNWEYIDVYFDEGISGTKLDKRTGLKTLLNDCEIGKIDLILTKSISRFCRNSIDCLELVRRLMDLNVYINFEKENINTETMDDELILSILSSLAENESQSISQNSKWSIEKRFQNGTYKISYPPYGYDWINGEMVVNEEQAVHVRKIFNDVLVGVSTSMIANNLNKQMVATKRGKTWFSSTIRGIIRNEKYTGDVLFSKTFTDDTFNRKRNRGEKNQYYMEAHHEAIISRQVFEKAQIILEQNAKSKNIKADDIKYQNRYVFSGIVKCGECGGTFKRRIQMRNTHEKYIAWSCTNHLKDKTSCKMKFIKDEQIKVAYATMINKLIFSHKIILQPLLDELKRKTYSDDKVIDKSKDAEVERLKGQINNLTNFLANGYIEQSVYITEKALLQQSIDAIEKDCRQRSEDLFDKMNLIQELDVLLKYVKKKNMLDSFDENLFIKTVNEVVVLSRQEILFKLKCGLTLKERIMG